MELYHVESTAERRLQQKADMEKVPLGGALELLPLCNMSCKMCYIKKSREELEKEGRLLSADEWIKILDEAVECGLLFLLLTGGEPLIYPEFKRLYIHLVQKGVILSVNSNGTLIDEEWADFFAAYGCRRLSITLYGKDDETYGRLCGNPKGFSQVMKACRLLKERKVPFRFTCSVTPDNREQLPELFKIAASFEVPLSVTSYMFPGERRGNNACTQYRLSPEDAAKVLLERYQLEYPDVDMVSAAKQSLSQLDGEPKHYEIKGFPCHAGHSGFWMSWKGDLLPCGMFDTIKINLQQHSFKECWDYIVTTSQQLHFCEECNTCRFEKACHVCPAVCQTETGFLDHKPEYMCKMVKEEIRLLEEILSNFV